MPTVFYVMMRLTRNALGLVFLIFRPYAAVIIANAINAVNAGICGVLLAGPLLPVHCSAPYAACGS